MNGDEAQISLMSWNIHTLRNKVNHVTKVTTERQVDIVFLQETHIGPDDIGVFKQLWKWDSFYTAHKPNSEGVAILIKNDIDYQLIESCKHNNGSYIIVKCEILGQRYTLVNVYNHPSERDILDKLIPYLQECTEGVLVIGGDFNTTINPYLDRISITQNSQHNSLRKCVARFTESLHLVDVWRRFNRTKRVYTYLQNDRESRLDYIFMQEESIWRVKTCEILGTPVEYSDHKPVWLQLTSTPSSHDPLPDTNEEKKTDILNKKDDSSCGNNGALIVDIPWAARSLPNSKPTGPDGIPVHFYKSNCSHLPHYFNVLYKQMLANRMHDAPNHKSFNSSNPSLDNRSYRFFNADYLALATTLAWYLEKHLKDMTARTEKKKNKIRSIMVIHPGRRKKVRWSLLRQAIGALKDPFLDSTIFDNLLRRSDQDQDCKQLCRGCPLTPALLKLYVTHHVNKILKSRLLPSGKTLGALIYGETVMFSLSFDPKASLPDDVKDELRRLERY